MDQNEEIAPTNEALVRCEQVIERGMRSFIEVGTALLKIRDERLYRETHRTFDEYCRDRWGWQENYASKQIKAAAIAQSLSTTVPIESERQIRYLAALPPEDRQAAWELAVEHSETGKPTGSEVEHVVRTLRDLQPAKSREQIQMERKLRDAEKALDQRYEERLRRFIAFSKLIDSVKYIADFHADSTGDFWDGITNAGGTETFSENSRKAQSLLARMESQHPNAVRRPTVMIKKLSSE